MRLFALGYVDDQKHHVDYERAVNAYERRMTRAVDQCVLYGAVPVRRQVA